LWRTVEYLVLGLGFQIGLGLGLALLLNREFKGKRLAQTVLVFPILTTPVVVAMLWKYLFDMQTGLINQVLGLVGIEPRPWLSVEPLPWVSAIPGIGAWLRIPEISPRFGAIILVIVWQWAPFCFLVLYAGLVSLPQEPNEAAGSVRPGGSVPLPDLPSAPAVDLDRHAAPADRSAQGVRPDLGPVW
jgi:multiple sugar transport system permease protein